MDFGMLAPEINSASIYAGPGPGPMLAAAAAWDQLSAELHYTATSYGSVVSGLTAGSWLGASSAAMAAAAAPYVAWMTTTAIQAEQAATQARAAAAAFEAAFAMTVPPPVVAANRSLLMTLIATNILGQNTAAIAATQAEYMEMWAQDAAAMYGYAGSSAAASTFTPFTPPPPTTDPAGMAGQGDAVGESLVSNGPQVMSALNQAVHGLAIPATTAAPLVTLPTALDPTTLITILTLIAIPLISIDIPIATTGVVASTTSATASFTSAGTTYRGFMINADRDYAAGKGPFTGYGPGGEMVPQWIFGGPNALNETPSAAPLPVAAGVGRGATVGALSVPPGWTASAPAFRTAAYALPLTAVEAAPEMVAGSSGNLVSEMALAGMAGRAAGTTAGFARGNERIRADPREKPKPAQRPQGEPVPEIAAELRELASRAQSLLAKLHDSGLMNEQEVSEQKRRFLGS